MGHTMGFMFDVSMALCCGALLYLYLCTFLHVSKELVSCVGWLFFVAFQVYINTRIGISRPEVNLLLTLGSVILVGLLGYQGNLWKRVAFPVAFVAIWMVVEALELFSIDYLSGLGTVSIQANRMNLALSELCMAVIVLGIRRFIRKRGIGDIIATEENMPASILPFVGIVLYYVLFQMARILDIGYRNALVWLILGALMLIIMNMSQYLFFGKWGEELMMRRSNRLYIRQMELYKKHMIQDAAAVNEVRKIKHDIRQELLYLKELAVRDEKEKLIATIEDMVQEVNTRGRMAQRTGNLVTDALVNHLWSECENKNILLHLDLNIPNELGILDRDLSVLLGNALDNALEASEHIEHAQREIWLDLFYEKKCLIIIIKNRYDGSLDRDSLGRIRSRKGQNHGIGLYSMNQITHRYQGNLKTTQEDEIFILEVMLYL